uniref:Splicing factor 3B subunit 1 n=2 Tax=Culex pipiens TaxID=7175 RepID=A0A8D8I5X7_CULPI
MENIPRTHEDIEAQIRDIQSKKKEISAEAAKDKGVGLLESGYYDADLYDGAAGKGKYEGYVTSIAPNDDVDDDEDDGMPMGRGGDGGAGGGGRNRAPGYTAPAALLNDVAQPDADFDPFADRRRPTVGEKEDEYRQKRRRLVISPERADPFADGEFLVANWTSILCS